MMLLLLLLSGVVMVDVVEAGLSWLSALTTGGETAHLMSAMPSSLLLLWVVMMNCKEEGLVRIFEVL